MNFISFEVYKSLDTFVPILQIRQVRLGIRNMSKANRREISKQF